MDTHENRDFTEDEISLREILEILWQGKKIIALITVIALILSIIFTFFIQEEKYETAVTLRVDPIAISTGYSSEVATAFADLEKKIALTPDQYAALLTNSKYLTILADTVNEENPGLDPLSANNIAAMMSAKADEKANTIKVTVSDSKAERAFAVADNIDNSFVAYLDSYVDEIVGKYKETLEGNLTRSKKALKEKEDALIQLRSEIGQLSIINSNLETALSLIKGLTMEQSALEISIAADLLTLETLATQLQESGQITDLELGLVGELKEAAKADNEKTSANYDNLDQQLYLQMELAAGNGQMGTSVRLFEFNRLQMNLLNNLNKRDSNQKQIEANKQLYDEQTQELTRLQPLFNEAEGDYNLALETHTAVVKELNAANTYYDLNTLESYVTEVNSPKLPSSAVSPNKKLNLAISLVLGLMLGIFIVFFKHYWQASGESSKQKKAEQK